MPPMLIEFTHDFRGRATQERLYLEGSRLELEDHLARPLIELGHAVQVGVVIPSGASLIEPEDEVVDQVIENPHVELADWGDDAAVDDFLEEGESDAT